MIRHFDQEIFALVVGVSVRGPLIRTLSLGQFLDCLAEAVVVFEFGSRGRTRTCNPPVNPDRSGLNH
jgi:hypothetical protein